MGFRKGLAEEKPGRLLEATTKDGCSLGPQGGTLPYNRALCPHGCCEVTEEMHKG